MSQYDPKLDLKINVGYMDMDGLTIHSPVTFPYILQNISCINTILLDYPSVLTDI